MSALSNVHRGGLRTRSGDCGNQNCPNAPSGAWWFFSLSQASRCPPLWTNDTRATLDENLAAHRRNRQPGITTKIPRVIMGGHHLQRGLERAALDNPTETPTERASSVRRKSGIRRRSVYSACSVPCARTS